MPSTFFGVEIARRSLSTNQRAMEVTQNNIANANTQGYSRQRAVMIASNPYILPILSQGQLGSGVEVKEVERLRDIFLDQQLRTNLAEKGFWESQENELAKIEAIFTKPAENSVSNLLTQFWNSWQELSNHPQEGSARLNVTQAAVNLTTNLNYLAGQLEIAQNEIGENLSFKVNELNELATQLGEINKSITKGLVQENHVLMDQRDLILDKMAALANLEVSSDENNLVRVVIGEQTIIEGFEVFPIEDTDPLEIAKGEIAGLLIAQEKIKGYQENIAVFSQTLAEKVNEAHRDGYTLNNTSGGDFFTIRETDSGAKEILVHEDILNNPNNIAAAQASVPGDGRNALAIANIKEKVNYEELGCNSLAGFYRQFVTAIGADKNQATQSTANFTLVAKQFEAQRQSLSGVSLDEELTMLMQYQYAYQASAQALKVFDEMLDTLINRIK